VNDSPQHNKRDARNTRSDDERPFLFAWQRAIADSALPALTRHVALTLSLYMDADGGSAFPGARRLADDTGQSLRWVRPRLVELVDAGWLDVVERGGLRGEQRRANRYQARIPDPGHTVTGDTPSRVTHRHGYPGHTVTGTSDAPSPHHSIDQPIDQHTSARSYEADFDRTWAEYPRKRSGRKPALKAYTARRRAGVSADDLHRATVNYAKATVDTEQRFVKLGATFYGPDDHWRDHLDDAKPDEPVKSRPVCPDHGPDAACFHRFGSGWAHDPRALERDRARERAADEEDVA
jgi:hypothetical protein